MVLTDLETGGSQKDSPRLSYPLRHCPPLSKAFPLPAAHPSLQSSRHTTRKEVRGQDLGRRIRESSSGETSKQEQVGGTEQRGQDQNMLQVAEWEGSDFRNRQKYLVIEGLSCHIYSSKQPVRPAPTPAHTLPTCRAIRQQRPQERGPCREAQEWEEGFWKAGGSGRGAWVSWEPTDRSWMGWGCDRLMLSCLLSCVDYPEPELSRKSKRSEFG